MTALKLLVERCAQASEALMRRLTCDAGHADEFARLTDAAIMPQVATELLLVATQG